MNDQLFNYLFGMPYSANDKEGQQLAEESIEAEEEFDWMWGIGS